MFSCHSFLSTIIIVEYIISYTSKLACPSVPSQNLKFTSSVYHLMTKLNSNFHEELHIACLSHGT